jgi:hypothetical protein
VRRLSNPSGNSSDDEIMKRGMRRNRDALLYEEEGEAPNKKLDKKLKLEQEKRGKKKVLKGSIKSHQRKRRNPRSHDPGV